MRKNILLAASIILMTACTQMLEEPVPISTIEQLSGTWTADKGSGYIHFYTDETVKLIFPKHQPPIKLIAQYKLIEGDELEGNNIGIGLGGFWSGPVLINTTDIDNNMITVTFPEEDSFQLYKNSTTVRFKH